VPAIPVTVISQAAGFAALLAALAIEGGHIDGHSFRLGLLSGLGGGVGLVTFYKALSLGTMSIVSPVVACGAVVPFSIAIATGERPGAVSLAGAGLALAGAVLSSVEEGRSAVPNRVRAVTLAAVASVTLGLFVYFTGLGSREGSALSTLVGARVGSLSVLLVIAAGAREPLRIERRWLAPVAAVGLCDVSANALFALATKHGLLSLVSVLGSLFPVMTLLLARYVLGERLTRLQVLGVGTALLGVAALSSG
jgi:drug/metabolite transporter (DMT)-like permease